MSERSRSLNCPSLCLYLHKSFWTVTGSQEKSLCRHLQRAEFRGVTIVFICSFSHVFLFLSHANIKEGREGGPGGKGGNGRGEVSEEAEDLAQHPA